MQMDGYIRATAVAAAQGNQRELHKIIRQLAAKQKKQRLQLRGTNGFLLSEEDEAHAVLTHMQNLFVDTDATSLVQTTCRQMPFEEADLLDAMARLPAHKATPACCAKSMFVKHSARILAPELYRRLSQKWVDNIPEIPCSWRSSWVVWLPKPHKDTSKMSGWRGISLQNPVGKSVLKSVERHVRICSDTDLQQKPQYAYSSARGTGEAIARAMTHQSIAVGLGELTILTPHDRASGAVAPALAGGFQVCLDIDKAFDGISRSKLCAAIQKFGIPAS